MVSVAVNLKGTCKNPVSKVILRMSHVDLVKIISHDGLSLSCSEYIHDMSNDYSALYMHVHLCIVAVGFNKSRV